QLARPRMCSTCCEHRHRRRLRRRFRTIARLAFPFHAVNGLACNSETPRCFGSCTRVERNVRLRRPAVLWLCFDARELGGLLPDRAPVVLQPEYETSIELFVSLLGVLPSGSGLGDRHRKEDVQDPVSAELHVLELQLRECSDSNFAE